MEYTLYLSTKQTLLVVIIIKTEYLTEDRGTKNKVLVNEWILTCFDLMSLLISFITLNNP